MRLAHLQAVTIITPYGRQLILGTTPICRQLHALSAFASGYDYPTLRAAVGSRYNSDMPPAACAKRICKRLRLSHPTGGCWFSVQLRYAASCMRKAHLQAVTIIPPYGWLLVLGTTPIILSSAFSSETRGAVDDEMHCQRASRSVRIASMISCGA